MLATTAGLWAKRRLEKPWLRVLLMLVLTAVVFLAGALTATLTRSSTTSSVTGGPTTGQGAIPGGTVSGGTVSGGGVSGGGVSGGGALAAVASARKQAATWVAQQVNPDEVIGCDPVMCAALEAAHVQANRLLLLGPSVPDPLGSEVLLDTATLRSFLSAQQPPYRPSLVAVTTASGRTVLRVGYPAPSLLGLLGTHG